MAYAPQSVGGLEVKVRVNMPMSTEMKKIADRIKSEIEHDVKEDQNN